MMLGHRPFAATGHGEQNCTLLVTPSARVQPWDLSGGGESCLGFPEVHRLFNNGRAIEED